MALNWRYKLDGTAYENPIGWDSIKLNIERDKEIRSVVRSFVTEVEFWGDGYDYLLSSFNTDPLSEVTCLVEYKQESDTEYTSFYNGIIRLSDVKFNLSRCLAKTEIEDNSWYAKILNNRELKSVVDVALSKDGTTINADSGS